MLLKKQKQQQKRQSRPTTKQQSHPRHFFFCCHHHHHHHLDTEVLRQMSNWSRSRKQHTNTTNQARKEDNCWNRNKIKSKNNKKEQDKKSWRQNWGQAKSSVTHTSLRCYKSSNLSREKKRDNQPASNDNFLAIYFRSSASNRAILSKLNIVKSREKGNRLMLLMVAL